MRSVCWRPMNWTPTGLPSTRPAGTDTAGLPEILAGIVNAPLLPGGDFSPATRVLDSISAGKATSGFEAQITTSTESNRSAMRRLASVRAASTWPATSMSNRSMPIRTPKAMDFVICSSQSGHRSPTSRTRPTWLATAHSQVIDGRDTSTSTRSSPMEAASASPASCTRARTASLIIAEPRSGEMTARRPRRSVEPRPASQSASAGRL